MAANQAAMICYTFACPAKHAPTAKNPELASKEICKSLKMNRNVSIFVLVVVVVVAVVVVVVVIVVLVVVVVVGGGGGGGVPKKYISMSFSLIHLQ